jgi:spermidine/putrescine transport system substrate-binding protein
MTRPDGLSRRDFLARAGLVGGAVAFGAPALLSACGGIKVANGQCTPPPQSTSKSLSLSNWTFYIDDKTVKDFAKATGIKTDYNEDFNDNEEYYGKVRPILGQCRGIGRDLIVPTDWMANRMILLGWAAKLDKTKIPNRVNLLDSLQHPSFDPNRDYTMPWQSGMTGIAYNKKLVAGLGLKPPRSVKDLLAKEYKGRITFLTEMRDTVGLWMLANGEKPENATIATAQKALDDIRQASTSGQVRRFTGNDYVDDLSNENIVAALAWSGDVIQLQAGKKASAHDFDFVVPDEGGMLFSDNMLVLATSDHIADAEAWINYVYDPEHAGQITDYVEYISPVKGVSQVLEKIDPDIAHNPLITPPDDILSRLHIFKKLTPEEEQEFNDKFNAILNA